MQEKGASEALLASLSLKTQNEFCLLLKQNSQDPSLFFIANTDQSMSVIGVDKTQTGFILKQKVSFSQSHFHSQKISDACFHSLQKQDQIYQILLTVSEDASLRVWDLQSGECVKVFNAQRPLYSVAARQTIVLCGAEQKIFTWNLIKMKEGNNFKDHSDDVTGLCFASRFSPRYVLSCSEDQLICLRDLSLPRNDALLVTVPTQLPLIECGFIDQTGIQEQKGLVWALSNTNCILIFDLDTCQKIKEVPAQELVSDSYCIGGLQKVDDTFFFILAQKETPKLFIFELRSFQSKEFSVLPRGMLMCQDQQVIRNAKCLTSDLLCLITTESGKIQLYQGKKQEETKQPEMGKASFQPSVQEDFLIIEDEEEESGEKKRVSGLRGYRPY